MLHVIESRYFSVVLWLSSGFEIRVSSMLADFIPCSSNQFLFPGHHDVFMTFCFIWIQFLVDSFLFEHV
jgi:hypothetical protein